MLDSRDRRRPVRRPLAPAPPQEGPVPWPVPEWPIGGLPDRVDLDALMAEAFDPAGPGTRPTPWLSSTGAGWCSSATAAFATVGQAGQAGGGGDPTAVVVDGQVDAPRHRGDAGGRRQAGARRPGPGAAVAVTGRPSCEITLQQLLEMRDGLDFAEEYEEPEVSDVLQMLFGRGRATGTFAADRPLAAPPGTRFNYSSGTSNIISGIVARTVGPGDRYRRFLADRLFGPLGMTSATVTLDDAGTWVAARTCTPRPGTTPASACSTSATGCGRAGGCCPRGGWTRGADPVRWTRTAGTSTARTGGRGGRPGTFWAAGHEGQYIDICPALDLVLVRMGRTDDEHSDDVKPWRTWVIGAFDPGSG